MSQKLIKELQAQLKSLQAQVPTIVQDKVTIKVTDDGALVFYGIKMKPLYLSLKQVKKIQGLVNSDSVQQFMNDNMEKLTMERTEAAE